MSNLQLIEFVATENHVKFRSLLSEMLYAKLSEQIKEKTKNMVSEIFETDRTDDISGLLEYAAGVIHETEVRLNTELTEEEIAESVEYIVSLLEANDEDEEEDEDEDEEEDEDEDDDDVDVEVHIDSGSHNEGGRKEDAPKRGKR